jgi:hypothetical protein
MPVISARFFDSSSVTSILFVAGAAVPIGPRAARACYRVACR